MTQNPYLSEVTFSFLIRNLAPADSPIVDCQTNVPMMVGFRLKCISILEVFITICALIDIFRQVQLEISFTLEQFNRRRLSIRISGSLIRECPDCYKYVRQC